MVVGSQKLVGWSGTPVRSRQTPWQPESIVQFDLIINFLNGQSKEVEILWADGGARRVSWRQEYGLSGNKVLLHNCDYFLVNNVCRWTLKGFQRSDNVEVL